MKVSNSEISDISAQLILPLFEDTKKAPNKSLSGLNRSQRGLVREALGSGGFEAKKGTRMSLWTPSCNIILVGMGDREGMSHKKARNAGARLISSLSKKKGTDLTVRFTTGWDGDRMVDFAEGMMLRDYDFLEHQEKPDDHIEEEWKVDFQASGRHQEKLSVELQNVQSVVKGVHTARDLGNEPANVLYPMEYARRALEWAEGKENVKVEVMIGRNCTSLEWED